MVLYVLLLTVPGLALAAVPACPPGLPCVLRCCPEAHLYTENSCRPSLQARPLRPPPFYPDPRGPPQPMDSRLALVSGYRPCPKGYYYLDPDSIPEDAYRILGNGSLYTPNSTTLILSWDEYCLDVDPDRNKTAPVLCFENQSNVIFAVYPVGMLISLPFLLATFLVYALIHELRNLHGKNVMSHTLSLLFGYIFLTVSQLTPEVSPGACLLMAFSIQFGFLATFFWLNVMCFDIWWTFSGLRKPGGSAKETERKKFLLYSCYAWGCPLLILIFTIIMDNTNILGIDNPFKPNLGTTKCFFESREASWLYFYGPMGILLVSNIVMFAFTARRIVLHTRETAVLKSKDSKRHDNNDRERFYLYLKLFLVMGINWVTELISWIAGGPEEVWYITDITNTLQGVFIFIIFVCKKRVLRLLNTRLCPSVKMWGTGTCSTENSNITQRSSVGNTEDSLRLRAPEEP